MSPAQPDRSPREEVAALLSEYDRALASSNSARLAASIDALAACSKNPPEGLDPKLSHYLQRQSYRKAIDHLAHSA